MSGQVWDPESVVDAIKRAGATWQARPADRGPAKLKAAWPETLQQPPVNFEELREFEEARGLRDELGKRVIALDGETQSTAWAPGFSRNSPPSPAEITHADMVAGWNQYFGGRVDLMDAVWVCHGGGFKTGDAAKIIARRRSMKHPYSKDMIRIQREVGVALIVRGLNRGALPRRPDGVSELPLEPRQLAALREACEAALDALDPFIAALAHGDPLTQKLVPVSVRHLYKAAQASARILTALKPHNDASET